MKFHLTNIYRKLGVSNRTEATRYAYENGLVDHSLPRSRLDLSSLSGVVRRTPVHDTCLMDTRLAKAETDDGESFATRVRRVLEIIGFGVLPLCLIVAYLSAGGQSRGFDFHQFWQGGHDVAHGISPYPAADRLPGSDAGRLDPVEIQEVFRFPYPAPAAVALAPLGLLPLRLATGIFLALLVLCIPAALLALGVRDWRCYGAAFWWLPVLTAVRLGTLTPLLSSASRSPGDSAIAR